jgi:hypothetical protein
MRAARKHNLLAIPRGVEVSPVGLKITARPSYEQWSELVKGLQRAHRSILWLIGDALVWGERTFGEEFSQSIAEYSKQTLYNAQWVSGRIEISRRLENLSWSHHQEVAALEPDAQDRFLREAVEHNWGVHELREAIKAFKLIEKPEPKIDWQEPRDPREIPPEYPDENDQDNGDLSAPGRPSIESEFRHLLQLCKALRSAEKNGAHEEAARLRTALDVFLGEHEKRGEGGRNEERRT